MSGEAVKAYIYLLSESWLQIPRATLPDSDIELAHFARVESAKWLLLKPDVMQCFKIGECKEHKGLWYNEKLLEISRKYEAQQRPKNKNAEKRRLNAE